MGREEPGRGGLRRPPKQPPGPARLGRTPPDGPGSGAPERPGLRPLEDQANTFADQGQAGRARALLAGPERAARDRLDVQLGALSDQLAGYARKSQQADQQQILHTLYTGWAIQAIVALLSLLVALSVARTTTRGVQVGLEDLQESASYFRPDVYQTPADYERAAGGLDWYARFDTLEPQTPRLLLAHNPDAAWLPGVRPLATLSGHTHGGQVMPLDWIARRLHRRLDRLLPPGSAVTWAGRRVVNGQDPDRQPGHGRGGPAAAPGARPGGGRRHTTLADSH